MTKGEHEAPGKAVGRGSAGVMASATPPKTAPLTLKEIKASIPAECFVKSPLKSMFYMFRDGGVFAALMTTMYMTLRSAWWQGLSPVVSGVLLAAYWLTTGFIMWCMFVVGHDCGHGSFSNSTLLNGVCGHIMHAPLVVPFYAWADSHRQHHQFHNHYERDMSFPWFTTDDMRQLPLRIVHAIRMTFPFSGFALYLAGTPDGGHWLPFGGRLWHNASVKRYTRGIISSATVLLWMYFIGTLTRWNLWFAFQLYIGCWLWFSFWLVTVTYLQHHDEHTTVYPNDQWNFLRGAFKTIDREYGYGIDDFHHNITDCHLVHHLFFTQIPHYNLTKATVALRAFLQSKGLAHLYRFRQQHDFYASVFRTLWTSSFRCYFPDNKDLAQDQKLFPKKK